MGDLRVESGRIASVWLSRPESRNAMSDETLRELAQVFGRLAKEPALRCVIVRGEGPDFCAGADIHWMRRAGSLPPKQGKQDAKLLAQMLSAVDECPVPVIVAAQGNIFGGGLGLMAVCDIGLVAENARLCFSECRLGIMPAVISQWVVPKIGEANARRYYVTSELFGSAQAVAMGLAHEAVAPEKISERAEALAEAVAKNGPNAVRAAKLLLRKFPALSSANKRLGYAIDTLVKLRSSPEGQEGLTAFLEKRPASWAKQP